MRFWQLLGHALQSVLRARLRSGLTALGIAISSGALVSMVALAVGLRAQVEKPVQQLGLLNEVEVRPARSPGEKSTEKGNSLATTPLDDAALEKFQRIPGVVYAYPDFRLSHVTVTHGDSSREVLAIGLPREASLIGVFNGLMVAGDYFTLGSDPQVVLAEKMSGELGFASPQAAVGEPLTIAAAGLDATPTGQFEMRRQQLPVRIVGVYRAPGMIGELGRGALLLPADLMRGLPGARTERNLDRLRSQEGASLDEYSEVTVRAVGPNEAFRVEKAIRELGFDARAVASRFQEARQFFLFMEVLLSAVGTVGLVVAGLGIMNTQLMSVMERYQEIGIYKAIGASDTDVRVLFLTEALVLGAAGGLGGLVLARVVCALLQWGLGEYAARQGVEHLGAVFGFPFWLLAGAVAYALLVSLISGVYPASRAARIDPISALRRG